MQRGVWYSVMKHTVYVLMNSVTKRLYKGYTTNLQGRLYRHATSTTGYTSNSRNWHLKFYCVFEDKHTALSFEKYLKTASGIAFTRKRLLKRPDEDLFLKIKSKRNHVRQGSSVG